MIGDHLRTSVLAFDPGGTTGIARLDAVYVKNEGKRLYGRVIYTYALEAEAFFQFLSDHANWPGLVVCEASPKWGHHNPVTRRVENMIRDMYPEAHLVQPSQWKNHPTSLCPERTRTKHEKEVVQLARWFLARRQLHEDSKPSDTSRANSNSPRRKRHRA